MPQWTCMNAGDALNNKNKLLTQISRNKLLTNNYAKSSEDINYLNAGDMHQIIKINY